MKILILCYYCYSNGTSALLTSNLLTGRIPIPNCIYTRQTDLSWFGIPIKILVKGVRTRLVRRGTGTREKNNKHRSRRFIDWTVESGNNVTRRTINTTLRTMPSSVNRFSEATLRWRMRTGSGIGGAYSGV